MSAVLPAPPRQPLPILLCLSHLRWEFVFQRPQPWLSRVDKRLAGPSWDATWASWDAAWARMQRLIEEAASGVR